MVRYKKLGYVALNVTDVERSSKFYDNIVGLQLVKHEPGGPAFLRCSQDHHNLILYPSDRPGLKRVGLEVEDTDQLEIAFEHFSKAGLMPQELSKEEQRSLAQGKTFRIKEPNSNITFEFYSDITQMAETYRHTVTKIARLGHVVIRVPELETTVKFFKEVMNFNVSDSVGEVFTFMRVFPNSFHHSFAIGQGKEHQFHHVNFMVSDIDDIGIARNRMINNGVPVVNGPGRHAPSGSIFLYYLDPDELTVEYSFGMEEFPESGYRKPKLLEQSRLTLDLWGGSPDPRYGAFGYIEK